MTVVIAVRAPTASLPVPQFFISPSGDDVLGTGTYTSPWSLNAFNSQRAKYTGTVVGLLPGSNGVYQNTISKGMTKSLYSLHEAITNTGNATALFQVNGGSSSSPTTVVMCDQNGNYSPRISTINPTDPVSGNPVTKAGVMILGQTDNNISGAPYPTYGNLILDGLDVQAFANLGIGYHNLTNTAVGVGLVIRNCHIHNSAGTAVSNNNPNGIAIGGTTGAVVTNNKIHDLTTSNSGTFYPYGQIAILAIGAGNGSAPTPIGATITNNTTYNCAGLNYKDSFATGTSNIAYNYFDAGTFGNQEGATAVTPFMQFLCGTGGTINYHHNLTSAQLNGTPEANITLTGSNRGQVNVYNNTHAAGQNGAMLCQPDPNTPGTWGFWNNLVATPNFTGGTTPYIIALDNNNYGFPSLNFCDYNAYVSNVTFRNHAAAVTQAQWLATYGFDTHSLFTVTSAAFANGTGPTASSGVPNIGSWAPNASSAYYTGAQGGGIMGAMNALGFASDGSGNIIGCNF